MHAIAKNTVAPETLEHFVIVLVKGTMENYTEGKPIAAGNYGSVSIVKCNRTGVQYGMKRVNWTNKTKAQQQESRNEVEVMRRLDHPNIVRFIDAFVENNYLHIVMEYADAMDLEKYLVDKLRRREAVAEGTIMRIFVQIALGLRTLHKSRLLHRDLKSANVFLTRSGGVKLGDFGFAKQLTSTLALAATVCGTPYYFSPELCQKTPYNNKADVWSLGVILYEMINLRKPFEAKNLPELRKRVVTEEPAPFVTNHVSADLKALCLSMLEKDSTKRPSVDEILRTPFLRAWLHSLASNIEQQQIVFNQKIVTIVNAHPRQPDEPPYVPPTLKGTSGTKKGTFDPEAIAKAIKGDEAEIDSTVKPKQNQPTEQLHTRVLPDARKFVSNDCPIEVVCELQGYLELVESIDRLKADIAEVTTTDVAAKDLISEVIGEAETPEEKRVREGLGDSFVRAVELTLLLSEADPESPQGVQYHAELIELLGEKSYLMSDLQRVAMQFELDR